MSEKKLNNFSLVSRLFGNLFYRTPTDPVLTGVFGWLQHNGLSQVWALETDQASAQAIDNMQMPIDPVALEKEYRALFIGGACKVPMDIGAYGADETAFLHFRQTHSMPEVKSAVGFGLVLLTASWIEDHLNSASAQCELFERFLLPCAGQFLPKLEAAATLPFYRSLAFLCREILAATADELEESEERG